MLILWGERKYRHNTLEGGDRCCSIRQRELRGKGLAMAELLTKKIATEYRDKALLLTNGDMQDIGKRRSLRIELQTRCNLTELEAVNIINGYHINDYVMIEARKEHKRLKKEQEENQCG